MAMCSLSPLQCSLCPSPALAAEKIMRHILVVLVVVWAGVVGVVTGDDRACPCTLAPADPGNPGGELGNQMWNCRNLLLPEVPTSCWALNPNVTQVDLFNHHITTIRAGDFDGLWNLRSLDTYKGFLETVEEGSLRGLTNLQYLDLGFGYLTEVPGEVSYLPQLEFLALEYNQITHIEVSKLLPLVNLQWLIFVRNQIEEFPSVQFLSRLTWLDLEANNLRYLPLNLLGTLTAPCQLWINDNFLSDVAAGTLLPLPDGSEIRTNASVAIWARDEDEMAQMLAKEWRVYDKNQQDLDLLALTHSCDEPYDPPTDFIHPCDM